MQSVCFWLMSNIFFLFCGKFFAHEMSSKSKWKNRKQKLKWNKTRVFNWRPSKSIPAVFQNALVILFHNILFLFIFQYCTKLATYRLCQFFYRPLYESDEVLCILSVAIWRRVISSNILKVETPLLGPSPGTYDLPYGRVSRWSLCCSWMQSGFRDISFLVETTIPCLFQCRNVRRQSDWQLLQQDSHFSCPLHTFIASSGPRLLVELRFSPEQFSGMFPVAVPN